MRNHEYVWPPVLDPEVRDKAVEVAKAFITPERAEWIRESFAESPAYEGSIYAVWCGFENFGWAKNFRNALRNAGLTDDMTPFGWGTHWHVVAELAVGIHRERLVGR